MKCRGTFTFLSAAVCLAALLVFAAIWMPPRTVAAQTSEDELLANMSALNAELEASGAGFRVEYAEYLTTGETDELGRLVFFNNRGNKQLTADFVPGDPRRGGRLDVTYRVDQTEGAVGLAIPMSTAAIDRAMTTWDNVDCSFIPIRKLPDLPGMDLGIVEGSLGNPPGAAFAADIVHAGWIRLSPPLPANVLAATFTFIWIAGPGGPPTDIDNNGKFDVAFREILYNNRFLWRINSNVDVETVALHEAGHGLSQAHFGSAFRTPSNGKLHFNPRAVMNAAYSGVQQKLAGTDNGGHCSIWASWPNQ